MMDTQCQADSCKKQWKCWVGRLRLCKEHGKMIAELNKEMKE